MKLKDMIDALPQTFSLQPSGFDIDIKGIAYDSRDVQKDFLFAAIKGENTDGFNFIPDAVKNGAAAIITERQSNAAPVLQFVVPDARDAMARLSSRFYGEPSKKLTLIGVTGTNGKTTTTYLIESIFKHAGFSAGVIGTVNYRYKDKNMDAPHTTPESHDLQKLLNDMVDDGVTHCVMEVSSHALSQKRVNGCAFKGAVFTNLTQDHLDYHNTMEDYFKSKARLFEEFIPLVENSFVVVNVDDTNGRRLKDTLAVKPITFSLQPSADIYPVKSLFTNEGIISSLNTPLGVLHISSKLLGQYNLQNIMAAVGVGIGSGITKDKIEKGIANLECVPGRIEQISSKKGVQVVVDYAHTGDALERLLTAIREIANPRPVRSSCLKNDGTNIASNSEKETSNRARIITVFGCGGNRDKGKRSIMGEIAARLSDITIITSDNPRNEDPMEIIKEIERGARGENYMIIPDRREAIEKAISIAEKGDFVVVAGKGHEKYQIIGGQKLPFDDVEEAKRAICLN